MDEETTGFWMVALGAATASGTWEGFRISPLRHTASLHVDGALTIKDDHPKSRDYALVLSHPSVDRDRILVAGRGGTIEFGHDLVDSLTRDKPGISPTLWLADLTTGECSERCELPRAPRGLPPPARPADPQTETRPADTGIDSGIGAGVGAASAPAIESHAVPAVASYAAPAADPSAIPSTVPAAALSAAPSTTDPSTGRRVEMSSTASEIH